jgi:hypothetical protein
MFKKGKGKRRKNTEGQETETRDRKEIKRIIRMVTAFTSCSASDTYLSFRKNFSKKSW